MLLSIAVLDNQLRESSPFLALVAVVVVGNINMPAVAFLFCGNILPVVFRFFIWL